MKEIIKIRFRKWTKTMNDMLRSSWAVREDCGMHKMEAASKAP